MTQSSAEASSSDAAEGSGVDIPDELLQALTDLALLLREEPDAARCPDIGEWARRLDDARERVARGDPLAPAHILSMFGAMGSLNDLQVGPAVHSTMSRVHHIAYTTDRALQNEDREAARHVTDEKSRDHRDEDELPAPGPADHGGHGGMATRELEAHDDEAD